MRPTFHLQEEDRPALHRICSHVEGMPLALELAAAWVDSLSLPAIAGEIENSLDFLEVALHDVPERHRSMLTSFRSWCMAGQT